MSEGMLGNIPLSEIQGLRNDLEIKIASRKGRMWVRRLKRFLREENSIGIPDSFKVTTDHRDGEKLIESLEKNGNNVGGKFKELLRSIQFVPLGVTYRLVLMFGDELKDSQRTDEEVRTIAADRSYIEPPIVAAPLVREMFSDKDFEDMGLRHLIVMRKPIIILEASGESNLLGLPEDFNGRWMTSFFGGPNVGWNSDVGFLFCTSANSQVL